ncbi:VanZ family protein [Amycolatopsis suaedae]|uniref:VanZ family protein n=1 Tax=Amycolatopsis suaedae TaxID=2510978 RepID=A0A4Q7JDC2_9PSEU|nr:VanZ family protein [Amycolatopsis suaedae]RZQ65158.1 VanZ family protein [Amycolatopsis suaedae]
MTYAQVTALQYGLIGFLAIWGIVLVPQIVVHLHRYAMVLPKRLLTSGVVTMYFTFTLALVMLPLPGPNTPRLSQTVQLQPFQWVADIGSELHKHGLSDAQWFTTQTFSQLAMNVLLFVPLGFFARTLWRRGIVGGAALGFGFSLLIEITQATANFGTAPFVYRVFDVDDLMANTAGALLGWIAAALFLALRKARATSTRTTVRLPIPDRKGIHLTQAR